MTVKELKEYILKHMTAEEALEKLLASSILKYEKLKFSNAEDAVHPELIIAMAALDLGWTLAIERDQKAVRGLVVGTEEYINQMLKK